MSRYDYHRRTLVDGPYGAQAKKSGSSLKRTLFLLLLFIFVISLFIYVFPEVDVILVPATQKVENNFDLTLSSRVKKADLENGLAPARKVEVSDSLEEEFLATGEKNVGEKASGEAVFYNQTGLNQPLTPQNDLVTESGQVFHVKASIVIPKAEVSPEGDIVYGTIAVPVVATEAGSQGNIGPVRLTIIDLPFIKQSKIYGQVKDKLGGGTDKTVKVVSADDLENAQRKLEGELKPKLRQFLKDKLNQGEVLDEKLARYTDLKTDKIVELGEETETFKMKLSLKLEALVWNKEEIKRLVQEKIAAGLEGDKRIIPSSVDVFEAKVAEVDWDKGQAKLKIHSINQVTLPVDLEGLKQKIKGLKEYEARRLLLAEPSIRDVRFKFHYSLTSRIPKNSNRINIKLAVD